MAHTLLAGSPPDPLMRPRSPSPGNRIRMPCVGDCCPLAAYAVSTTLRPTGRTVTTLTPTSPSTRSHARHVALAILALATGGFAIGTTEFVTMGLLPQI